jgi:hypothetical protein
MGVSVLRTKYIEPNELSNDETSAHPKRASEGRGVWSTTLIDIASTRACHGIQCERFSDSIDREECFHIVLQPTSQLEDAQKLLNPFEENGFVDLRSKITL